MSAFFTPPPFPSAELTSFPADSSLHTKKKQQPLSAKLSTFPPLSHTIWEKKRNFKKKFGFNYGYITMYLSCGLPSIIYWSETQEE